MKLILGAKHQHETQVDAEDYQYLIQWRWTFKRSSKKYDYAIYARRCARINKKKTTILLSHVILERAGKLRPSKNHTADHIDGNTLNDTRANLRWATKKQQSNNLTPRRKAYLSRYAA